MRYLFKDNIPLVELVLRTITGKQDLVITDCRTQKDMKRLAGARSICLDAYGMDSLGQKYDLEIQRADRGANPHRARYHSSVMGIENLNAGQEFNELPNTYTIFITEKDFYGKDEPIYHIERINQETGEPFGDGEHSYQGRLYNLKALSKLAAFNRAGNVFGSIAVTTKKFNIPVKLVFVRNRNKAGEYIVLLTTDCSLSNSEVIRLYGNRCGKFEFIILHRVGLCTLNDKVV